MVSVANEYPAARAAGGGFAELTYCDNMYQPAHIEIEVVLAETFWVDHNSYPYNLWSRGSIV